MQSEVEYRLAFRNYLYIASTKQFHKESVSLIGQEAQLSPSDHAMRLVSSNLANCHAIVQKLLKAKFHYTGPTGPARTQRSFATKKVRAGPVGSV